MVYDITIIGAGPVGLSAAYYAGHREATVCIVESLEQLGGQVAAVYPEKHVYDVAGHPKIQGQALVDLCAEQGLQFGADVFLGEEVHELVRTGEGDDEILTLTTLGKTIETRAIIVTAGHGAFEPRKLGIDGIDEWEGKRAPLLRPPEGHLRGQELRDRRRRRLGARLDARPPGHGRRCRSRSSTAATASARSSRPSPRRASSRRRGRFGSSRPPRCVRFVANGVLEALVIEKTATGELSEVPCEALITLLGFHSHLGSIAEWGLELHGKRQVLVNPETMETTIPRVYSAGDVAGYEGKITLITIGMGEAAIAANNAIARDPRREGPAEVLDGLAAGPPPFGALRGGRRARCSGGGCGADRVSGLRRGADVRTPTLTGSTPASARGAGTSAGRRRPR